MGETFGVAAPPPESKATGNPAEEVER